MQQKSAAKGSLKMSEIADATCAINAVLPVPPAEPRGAPRCLFRPGTIERLSPAGVRCPVGLVAELPLCSGDVVAGVAPDLADRVQGDAPAMEGMIACRH